MESSTKVLTRSSTRNQVGVVAQRCSQIKFEGIVAKRKTSFYEPGKRTGAWLKYRINKGQECVIGGYGPDGPFDSIIVGYYQDGKLLYAAKVRNGFVPYTRREVAAKLQGL